MIEQTKLTYLPLEKAFNKQTKKNEALQNLKSLKQQKQKSVEDMLTKELQNKEIKKELD